MADKILNVKLREAYDTEANWTSNNPVLLKGQMAISSDKNGMHKVGDGTSTWSALSYAKAPASDVYDWAKASTKPTYTKSEIGLENVENKSSATIRSELTSDDVVTAIGYVPISGITATAPLVVTNTDGSVKISHTSSVIADSYGDSSNQTPYYGETFKVPYITVDAKGIITERGMCK